MRACEPASQRASERASERASGARLPVLCSQGAARANDVSNAILFVTVVFRFFAAVGELPDSELSSSLPTTTAFGRRDKIVAGKRINYTSNGYLLSDAADEYTVFEERSRPKLESRCFWAFITSRKTSHLEM